MLGREKELEVRLEGFYALLEGFLSDNTLLEDAQNIIDAMYPAGDLLALLETHHGTRFEIFYNIHQHPTLKPLLVYFFNKAKPLIREAASEDVVPQLLLREGHLQRIAPEITLDEALMPYVNTKEYVDLSVLDALLFRLFWEKLSERGIALMPATRGQEPINPDLLKQIQSGEAISYVTNIAIEKQGGAAEVVPQVNIGIRFTRPVHCAVWPVWLENRHWGLFFLDLRLTLPENSPRGIYIEPLGIPSCRMMFAEALPDEAICEHLLRKNVKPLIKNLDLLGQAFSIAFLAQQFDEACCGEYVTAVLARIALGEVDCSSHLDTLLQLKGQRLDHAMAKSVRLLAIHLFGLDYGLLQLPKKFKDRPEVVSWMTEHFLRDKTADQAANSASPLSPALTDAKAARQSKGKMLSHFGGGFFPTIPEEEEEAEASEMLLLDANAHIDDPHPT